MVAFGVRFGEVGLQRAGAGARLLDIPVPRRASLTRLLQRGPERPQLALERLPRLALTLGDQWGVRDCADTREVRRRETFLSLVGQQDGSHE